jgi:SWI/SNF-related matrix-associated actin-dependent regulator 1 of chromatin subfamily A
MLFPNKYQGVCNNPSCNCQVSPNSGFTQKINGRYVVWCNHCVPQHNAANQNCRVLNAQGQIIMPYEAENIDLIKSLPGARWNPNNRHWTVSLNMSDRSRILDIADRIGLDVDQSLRNVEVTHQAQNAMHVGLYPFQIEGVNFISQKSKSLLGDEMGLGKTVQSLMAIPLNGAGLVICRAGLKYNWLDETKKWRKDLTPVVLKGRNNFRWPKNGELVIINNDILPEEFNTPKKFDSESMNSYWDRLKTYREGLKKIFPQMNEIVLIVDEAHDYKNNHAARSRKVKEIVKMSHKVIGLTGSPLNNRPEDLFHVLDVLGLAKDSFGSWDNFQKLFGCEYESIRTRGRYINKTIWGKPKPIVPELLRRVMLRRRREEVLPDLPKKTYTNMIVGDVDSDLKKSLDCLWGEWKGFVENSNELPPFEKFSEIRERLARSRIPAMLDYIENSEEQEVPLVVFSSHLAPLDALLFRPGWAVITGLATSEKRQEIVRAFQAGKLKGVGVSIQAGGVGINLSHAWKALFVDLDWTPAANWQA